MMSTSKPRLDRIDLSTNSRNTLAALVKLLTPHVPYSLHILGAILNTGARSSTLQDVDTSKVSLWSTIPLHSDAISNADPNALFSVIAFSHLNHQFYFFCSGESRTSPDGEPPTEAEEAHVKQVFEHLLDIAREAPPRYDSILSICGSALTHRVDTDPPVILVPSIHAKWLAVLAPMSTCQISSVRYVLPRGTFARDTTSLPLAMSRTNRVPGGADDSESEEMEVSEIRASDVPFVYGASTIQRTDAYLMSRAPYSVCLRERGGMGADEGRPVACALMHCDGSIGALRVDPKYRRQGLGTCVIRALAEKLDFSKGRGESELISDDRQDLGGGALGWNWMDTEAHNEAGNRFFTSLVGKENMWTCHWTFMPVHAN